jgi:hypothetical protein
MSSLQTHEYAALSPLRGSNSFVVAPQDSQSPALGLASLRCSAADLISSVPLTFGQGHELSIPLRSFIDSEKLELVGQLPACSPFVLRAISVQVSCLFVPNNYNFAI